MFLCQSINTITKTGHVNPFHGGRTMSREVDISNEIIYLRIIVNWITMHGIIVGETGDDPSIKMTHNTTPFTMDGWYMRACWIVLEEVEEVEDEEATALNLEKIHHPHIFLDGLMHQWVQTKVVKTCVDASDDCLWG